MVLNVVRSSSLYAGREFSREKSGGTFYLRKKQTQKLARFSFPRQESYLFLLIKPDSIPDIERKIIFPVLPSMGIIFPVLFTYTTGAPKAEK